MVVTSENYESVYDTGIFIQSLGINSFNASRFIPASASHLNMAPSRVHIKSMLEQLLLLEKGGFIVGTLNPIPSCFGGGRYLSVSKGRSCSAGSSSAAISPSGDFRLCQHFYDSVGNVADSSIEDLWKISASWRDSYPIKKCLDCGELDSCGGGCRQSQFIITGDLGSTDSLFSGSIGKGVKANFGHNINKNDEIYFVNGLRRRRETEGGIYFRSLQNFVYVNDAFYDLIPLLYNKPFTIKELPTNSNQDLEKLINVFSLLHHKGIIKIRR